MRWRRIAFPLLLFASSLRGESTDRYDIDDDNANFNRNVTDADFSILDKFPQVREIHVGNGDYPPKGEPLIIGDAAFAHIANCRKLEWLALMGDRPFVISDDALKALENLGSLKHVIIWHPSISNRGVAHLAGLKTLLELSLPGATKLDDDALDTIGGLTELRILDLGDSSVTDRGIAKLAKLTKLYDLNLRSTTLGDEGAKIVGTFSRLIYLDLSNTKVSNAGIANFGKLPLRQLFLDGVPVTDLAPFKTLSELRWLRLENTQVDDAGMAVIAHLKNLQTLCISNTKVTDAGIAAFKDSENVRFLKLNALPLTDASVDIFLSMKHLESIDIRNTKISAAGEGRLKARGIKISKLD